MSDFPEGFPGTSSPSGPVELRGLPTAACPLCGGTWFVTAVTLDPDTYEIASWMLQGVTCHDCGSLVTLACPPDHPNFF